MKQNKNSGIYKLQSALERYHQAQRENAEALEQKRHDDELRRERARQQRREMFGSLFGVLAKIVGGCIVIALSIFILLALIGGIGSVVSWIIDFVSNIVGNILSFAAVIIGIALLLAGPAGWVVLAIIYFLGGGC